MECREVALLESERLGHYGNTGGYQPPPSMVSPVQNSGAVAVLERIAQERSAV